MSTIWERMGVGHLPSWRVPVSQGPPLFGPCLGPSAGKAPTRGTVKAGPGRMAFRGALRLWLRASVPGTPEADQAAGWGASKSVACGSQEPGTPHPAWHPRPPWDLPLHSRVSVSPSVR